MERVSSAGSPCHFFLGFPPFFFASYVWSVGVVWCRCGVVWSWYGMVCGADRADGKGFVKMSSFEHQDFR